MKALLVLLTLLTATTFVAAHPASEVDLRMAGDTLIVTAMHKVKNPAKHYIDDITIAINGEELLEKEYVSQTSKTAQSVSIVISKPLSAGDKITVITECNKFGEKAAELTITK